MNAIQANASAGNCSPCWRRFRFIHQLAFCEFCLVITANTATIYAANVSWRLSTRDSPPAIPPVHSISILYLSSSVCINKWCPLGCGQYFQHDQPAQCDLLIPVSWLGAHRLPVVSGWNSKSMPNWKVTVSVLVAGSRLEVVRQKLFVKSRSLEVDC